MFIPVRRQKFQWRRNSRKIGDLETKLLSVAEFNKFFHKNNLILRLVFTNLLLLSLQEVTFNIAKQTK